jgi:hypothetical protein
MAAYQGADPYSLISAASTNATSVATVASNIWSIEAFSLDGTPVYLKLYDDSSAPTVGTDTPVKRLMIPGTVGQGNGFTLAFPRGIYFANGIGFGLTTGIADNNTGAVAANEVLINIDHSPA